MPLTIPQYIEVKSAIGDTVACLSPEADALKDCEIDNELNGECTLTFSLPIRKFNNLITTLTLNGVMPTVQVPDSDKWGYLTDQYRIYAGGREFTILGPDAIEVQRDGQKKWGRIKAHESWVELGNHYAESGISNDPQNPTPPVLSVIILSGGAPFSGCTAGSAKSALSYLLQGTGWTVGTVDVEGVHDLETEKESILANIQKVQETWGGILVWDSLNHKVSLRDETLWQNYTGYQIRYAKNLKNITRTDNYGIVTRLYPFGEDDLSIASVNGGIPYLDNFSYTSKVLIGIWENQEIADPQELKDKATKYLETICRPRHNYQVKHVDLRILPGYQHEDFDIGDMVDVVDDELSINIRARVIRYKYDVFHPWQCDLEVGDPIENGADILADSDEIVKYIRGIRNSKGQITAYKLVNESIIAEKIAKAAIDATKLNTKVVVINDDTWTDNSPSPGSIAWNQHKLYYAGVEHVILAGSTNQKYIYWDGVSNTYTASADTPTLTDGQFIIAVNNGGLHDTVWDKGYAREFIGSALIAQAAILSAHIAEAQILDAHIANLNANKINVTDLTALTSDDGFSRMVGTGFETYDPSGNLMVKQGGYQTLGDQSATFTRASTAYTSTGTQVAAGVPRYETGKFSQAITAEDGTTNIIPVADHDFQNGAWAAYGGATVTVTGGQTDPFSGSGAYRIQTSGGTHVLKYYASWGVSVSGTPYAESVWVKCLAGTIRVMQLPGSTYQDIIPADGYVRVKLTGTGDGAAGIQMQFHALNVADALDFVVYRPQIETKAYITSWTDSARSPESLTIPGSVLNPQEGTVMFWFINVDGRTGNLDFWYAGGDVQQEFIARYNYSTQKVEFWSRRDGVYSTAITDNTVALPIGMPVHLAFGWSLAALKIYVNGSLAGQLSNPGLPTAISGTMSIGYNRAANVNWVDGLIDDLRISSIARTDEEILAAYQSNQPLPADRHTTWKSSFDDTLAQTVAQYGLYSESGTLIGQVIKGSEIYGTNIQTGNKTDTSYIKLGAYADEPLEVVKDRKAALQIWTYDTGGSIVFYDTAVNDIRGMITVYSNAYGDGLRLIGRSISGGYNKDVVAEGRFIRLHAPDVYIGNGEDYGTTVWGDLHITGDISIGGIGKGCIVDTASYGRRWLYAVEGPEIRLEEKGRGTLIDGQCRIDLHPKFLQTIEKDLDTAPWVIDITPHFDARLYVSEIGDNYFVVKECGGGVSNGRFSWSLSAVKIGCIGVYMPEFRPEGDILTSSWEDDLL